MSSFSLYLELGISHILDLKGYDHILFLVVLCAIHPVKEWKRVLILITAFTLGHTATLILATFELIKINGAFIEFLIPVTILITAISNFFYSYDKKKNRYHILRYFATIFFGLIHGLGFSNYIRALLGGESSILKPLLAFNIGIEAGQIIIVIILFLIFSVLKLFEVVKQKQIGFILSSIGLIVSFILAWNRFPF